MKEFRQILSLVAVAVLIFLLCPSTLWGVTGYPLCSEGTSHTITRIKNTGVIEIERQDRPDISCSLGFSYVPAQLSSIIFEYNTKCFNFVFSDLPIDLEFNGYSYMYFRSDSRRTHKSLDDSGLYTLKIYGQNQPPIDSFQLQYWSGKSFCGTIL